MNKLCKQYTGGILFLSILLFSCDKSFTPDAQFQPVNNNAYLRVVHISPNFRAIYGKADSMNIMIDGAKVNSTVLSFNGVFPNAVSNSYFAITPGTRAIELALPNKAGTVPDSTYIITKTRTVNAGRYYSLFMTDNIISPNDASQIWLKDDFTVPANGSYGLRFVHGVLNDAPNAIDVFSTRNKANIFAAYTPGKVSAFTQLPFNTIADTLIVRRTGTTTELARLNNISFENQRVYTLYYKGNAALTTGIKARSLAYCINQ